MQPPPPNPPPEDEPAPLDYFSAHAPQRRVSPKLHLAWLVLAVAWIPFVCGIVNRLATIRSAVPEIIAAHHNAAILLMGAGVLLSAISLAAFALLRAWRAVIAAAVVIAVQIAIALCLGHSDL